MFIYKFTDLNIAGNLIISYLDIFTLSNIETLRNLNLNDPNFGENPICHINNYRVFVIRHLPFLEILDEIKVTVEEKKDIDCTYAKKNLFYRNKIKIYHNTSKSLFMFIKSIRNYHIVMKSLKIKYLMKRLNMLESIDKTEGNNEISLLSDIENTKNYINKYKKSIDTVKEYVRELKSCIIDINDLMIVM